MRQTPSRSGHRQTHSCQLASLSPGQYVTLFYIFYTADLAIAANDELHRLGGSTVQRQSLRQGLVGEPGGANGTRTK